MFEALIRRKGSRGGCSVDEFAEESTLFSLSTDVPRPTDRRTDERLVTILPIAKLVTDAANYICRIKNISAGGLMAEVVCPIEVGEKVYVEMNSEQRIPGRIVWRREGSVGLKFDQDVDLRELLANRRPRRGFRPRPPRLEVSCGATVQIGKYYHQVEVHDISLGGMKVEPIAEYCVGKSVVVVVESLRPIKGEVRWYADRRAGIVFEKPLTFEELSEWVGKRLELASLKASYQKK